MLDFAVTRDMGWQWHQLDHMKIICTWLQTNNHASTTQFFLDQMPFLPPNQQCQSTEGYNIPMLLLLLILLICIFCVCICVLMTTNGIWLM